MSRVVLVGENEWTDFAKQVLMDAGEHTVQWSKESTDRAAPTDLVVLSAGSTESPSAAMGGLFKDMGPLRILVIDALEDFSRAGDATRAHAVGYEGRPWNQDVLLKVISRYKNTKAPDEGAIARRFGP